MQHLTQETIRRELKRCYVSLAVSNRVEHPDIHQRIRHLQSLIAIERVVTWQD